MLKPMLLIGVGGSGGKTLQLLHRELRWRLRDMNWKDGVPQGWQFVHIDAPAEPDTMLGNEADLINSVTVGGSYVPLSIRGVNYRNLDQTWLDGAGEKELATVASWRPRPEDVGISLETGAGQYRAIGRVMALSRAQNIRDAVQIAIQRITDPGVQPQLQRLTSHLGGEGIHSDQPPQVVIISSIAGGSGAGMFLDVADIVRSVNPSGWQDSSMGVLYTADVFSDIPPASRVGVMPNSLAALCELMAGYWNGDQPGDEFGALSRRGISAGGFTRRGIRFPMLVGRSNGRVDFPSQNSVYEASAKTLAAYMTSPSAQTSVTAYLTGNWTSTASGMVDNSGLTDGVKETVVSAMGMGSLSLGRDRFGRYASQRLARASVDFLLRHHQEGWKVPEEITDEDALDQAVLRDLEWFISACHLDEIGEHKNQVLDSLRPDVQQINDQLRRDINGYLNGFTDAHTPSQWGSLILGQARERAAWYVSETDAAIRSKATVWCNEISNIIVSAFLEAVARSGLAVATELLNRSVAHVGEVISDLSTEIQSFNHDAGRLDEGVYGSFNEWGDATMMRENDLLGKAVGRVVTAFSWEMEARLRGVASELLRDLAQNYLTPLHKAAHDALLELRTDEHPPAGTDTVGIENWPTADVIPPALHPALNERLVEPIEGFPQAYEKKLIETTRSAGQTYGFKQAERIAIGELATSRGTGMDPTSVGERLSDWWPATLSSQQAPSIARFELNFGGADLLDRASEWANRQETAIGEYIDESLRSYVLDAPDPAQGAQRQRRVLDAFQEVLSVASPLVKTHNALLTKVHPGHHGPQYHFTSIPFDQHEMRAEFEAIGASSGLTTDPSSSLHKAFGVGNEQRIEVITTLSAPLQPVVLDSVFRPIADQWIEAKSKQGERSSFWRWRRARPLVDFIPVSPAVRRAIQTGWFLGRLLGEVSWDREDLNGSPARVWDAEFQQQVDLPFPLIGPPLLNDTDLLPAILESIGLAMVECHVQNSLTPLRPYQLLRQLGEESSQTLNRWILHNQTRSGTEPMVRAWRAPKSEVASRELSTPSERQAAVLAYFEGRYRNYVEVFESNTVTRATLLQQPRHLDLKSDLAAVFQSLQAEAGSLNTVYEDDGGD